MSKKVNDGWHTILGNLVYVENGKVMYGMKKDYNGSWVTAAVYRGTNHGYWVNENRCNTVDAFRAGVKRRTIVLM